MMKKTNLYTGLIMMVMLMVSITLSAQQTIPFIDGFENGSLQNYWTTGGSGTATVSGEQFYNGAYALALNADNNSSSVEVELNAVSSPELTFWYYFDFSQGKDLTVDINTDGSWTTIWTDNVISTNDDQWLYKAIDLSSVSTSSGSFKLKFTVTDNSGLGNYPVYLDDIGVNGPANPSPLNSSDNGLSGTLTWDHAANVSSYDVKFGEAGNMSTVESGTSVSSSSGSYSYSGLDYQKEYEWQIVYYKADGTQIGGFVWSFHTSFGPKAGTENDPFEVSAANELIALSQNSGYGQYHYKQTTDISFNSDSTQVDWDGDGSANWDAEDQLGFSPIGDERISSNHFSGSYDGKGFSIDNLYIDRPGSKQVGLFGFVNNTTETVRIENVTLNNPDYNADAKIGGFIGKIEGKGLISNCHATNVQITAAGDDAGGLIGHAYFNIDTLTIENCSTTGKVESTNGGNVGGLLGEGQEITIQRSYSTADVTASGDYAGGLIGWIRNSEIKNSYATGSASANLNDASFSGNLNSCIVTNCYSAGDKAFAGYSSSTITNCFAKTAYTSGVSEKSTAELKDYNTYTDESSGDLSAAWDFVTNPNDDAANDDYWDMDQKETVNNGYPILSWQDGADNFLTAFILVFNTNNSSGTTIDLPLYGSVDVTVDWGDGNTDTYASSGDKSHNYTSEGTYTVSISGTLTQFGNEYNTYTGADKLTKVTDFGELGLTSLSGAFHGADNLTEVPADLPSGITDLTYCFWKNDATSFTNLDQWDVSQVTDMSNMFDFASNFNQDVSSWNVSNVTDMSYMFRNATSFNQDISNWDVSSASNMRAFLKSAENFNQDIGSWNVSNVTNISSMFNTAKSFNQDISNWDVSNVTNFAFMFKAAESFNQDISTQEVTVNGVTYTAWDVKNGESFEGMFRNADAFNKNIGNWNMSNATDLEDMFYYAINFNQNVNTKEVTVGSDTYTAWDIQNVTTLNGTFQGAESFNQDIGNWNTSNVTTMYNAFNNTTIFNQDINTQQVTVNGVTYTAWDMSKVGNMGSMFLNADAFNSDISNWNTSAVTDMSKMFDLVDNFNQPLITQQVTIGGVTYTAWDVSNVTKMNTMFNATKAFNQDLSSWDVGSVENMSGMFRLSDAFDQDISSWDVSSVTDMSSMFEGVTLSTANYDALLTGWAAQTVQQNVTFNGGNSEYSSAAASDRQSLINDDSWTITDGGQRNYSGGSGSSSDPFKIASTNDLIDLSNTSGDWDQDFAQTADISFNANETTVDWNGDGSTGPTEGFSPIGNSTTKFTGSYNGQNHTIENIYLDRPNSKYNALFGYISGGTTEKLGVTNVDINGADNSNFGANSTFDAALAGKIENNTTITQCYSTGSVKGNSKVGGLIGLSDGSSISRSYSTADIDGTYDNGGFMGKSMNSSTVSNCYATGDVDADNTVGGFIGYNDNSTIENSYCIGEVIGSPSLERYFAYNGGGTINDSFWNVDTDGDSGTQSGTTDDGATGKTTSEMQNDATFTDVSTGGLDNAWDFNNTWAIDDGSKSKALTNDGYPYLMDDSGDPLPVTWLSFTGERKAESRVELNWSTASEQNNDRFEIQRSDEGEDFTSIGKRKGAGNSNQMVKYQYTDTDAPEGTVYYRLKQVDYNGAYEYSDILAIQSKDKMPEGSLSVYPNPVSDKFNLQLPEYEGKMQVEVYNMSGQQVYQKEISERQSLVIPSAEWPEGAYMTICRSQSTVFQKRIIKE